MRKMENKKTNMARSWISCLFLFKCLSFAGLPLGLRLCVSVAGKVVLFWKKRLPESTMLQRDALTATPRTGFRTRKCSLRASTRETSRI
jgi:hypothetical protein